MKEREATPTGAHLTLEVAVEPGERLGDAP
jgi:hypothetical protein